MCLLLITFIWVCIFFSDLDLFKEASPAVAVQVSLSYI